MKCPVSAYYHLTRQQTWNKRARQELMWSFSCWWCDGPRLCSSATGERGVAGVKRTQTDGCLLKGEALIGWDVARTYYSCFKPLCHTVRVFFQSMKSSQWSRLLLPACERSAAGPCFTDTQIILTYLHAWMRVSQDTKWKAANVCSR